MHFKEYDWDDETDHDWYEFSGIEETNDIPTTEQSIPFFVAMTRKNKNPVISSSAVGFAQP